MISSYYEEMEDTVVSYIEGYDDDDNIVDNERG